MTHEAWVDYSLGENLKTYTIKSFFDRVDGEIKLGDPVKTKDSFGNTCDGIVGHIENEIVRIDLDKDSYKSANAEGYNGN